jgi:hypothetical protein
MSQPPAPMDASYLDDLVRRFAAGSITRDNWTHTAHLSVGVWHVVTCGADEAIARLRIGIRALNDRHGTPNTANSGYHETITVAHVRLIAAFASTLAKGASFQRTVTPETCLRAVLAGPLADKQLLLRYWSRSVLMSAAARASWVEPDVAPLLLPPGLEPNGNS